MRYNKNDRSLRFFLGGVPAGGATVAVPVPTGGTGVGRVVGLLATEPTSSGFGGNLGMFPGSTTGSGEFVLIVGGGTFAAAFELCVPGRTVSSGFLPSAYCLCCGCCGSESVVAVVSSKVSRRAKQHGSLAARIAAGVSEAATCTSLSSP